MNSSRHSRTDEGSGGVRVLSRGVTTLAPSTPSQPREAHRPATPRSPSSAQSSSSDPPLLSLRLTRLLRRPASTPCCRSEPASSRPRGLLTALSVPLPDVAVNALECRSSDATPRQAGAGVPTAAAATGDSACSQTLTLFRPEEVLAVLVSVAGVATRASASFAAALAASLAAVSCAGENGASFHSASRLSSAAQELCSSLGLSPSSSSSG